MAFGQQSGRPATGTQVRELLDLVQAAGYADFRDARHPLGFTQRQAAGKFTGDEVDSYIAALQTDDAAAPDDAAPHDPASNDAAPAPVRAPRLSATEQSLRKLPAEQLAAELQRRGWIVMEP